MGSPKGAISLADYVAARKKGKCYVCDELPPELRAEVEQTRPYVSLNDIVNWLHDVHGVESATRHKLERHWQNKHVVYGDQS